MLKKFFPVVLLLGSLAFAFTACTPTSPSTPASTSTPAAQPMQINSLADLRSISLEIVAVEPSMAQARADQLWQTLLKEQRVPLIFETKC